MAFPKYPAWFLARRTSFTAALRVHFPIFGLFSLVPLNVPRLRLLVCSRFPFRLIASFSVASFASASCIIRRPLAFCRVGLPRMRRFMVACCFV